jgi:hypothetical protein
MVDCDGCTHSAMNPSFLCSITAREWEEEVDEANQYYHYPRNRDWMSKHSKGVRASAHRCECECRARS